MASNQMPFCVLMSKADKLSNNKRAKSKATLKKVLAEMNIEVPILLYSSDSKLGIEAVQKLIEEFVIT